MARVQTFFKSLFNLFPILFAMILLAAILFPIMLLTLAFMQAEASMRPLLVVGMVLWPALALTAIPMVLRDPLSRSAKRNWILAIIALPFAGAIAWFLKKYRELP